jgi:hypothetical protein
MPRFDPLRLRLADERLAPVVSPPVSSICEPLPPMLSVQSLTWSLRLLIWSLICARLDHRNSPAAAAPAATAAAATGRSRAKSITPPDQSLPRLRLLLELELPLLLRLPRLLFLGMPILLFDDYALVAVKRLSALAVSLRRKASGEEKQGSGERQAVAS